MYFVHTDTYFTSTHPHIFHWSKEFLDEIMMNLLFASFRLFRSLIYVWLLYNSESFIPAAKDLQILWHCELYSVKGKNLWMEGLIFFLYNVYVPLCMFHCSVATYFILILSLPSENMFAYYRYTMILYLLLYIILASYCRCSAK